MLHHFAHKSNKLLILMACIVQELVKRNVSFREHAPSALRVRVMYKKIRNVDGKSERFAFGDRKSHTNTF